MSKMCSVCGRKLGLLSQYVLADGTMCGQCFTALLNKTKEIHNEHGVKFKGAAFCADDVKYCLEHSAEELEDYVEAVIYKNIENENQAYLKKAEEDLQSRCCICGTNSLIKAFSAKTSDGRLVCPTCMDYVPTIEPAALKQTKEYIKNHTSEFFYDNTFGYLERYPSNIENLRMVVNHKTGYISLSSEVYPVRSIERIQTETGEYEVFRQNNDSAALHRTGETRTKSRGTPEVIVFTRGEDGRLKKRVYYCSGRAQAQKFEKSLLQMLDFACHTNTKNAEEAGVTSSAVSRDEYSDLVKLKELLDAGVLTQEEFDIKKKQILKL